jgi:chorismate mutase
MSAAADKIRDLDRYCRDLVAERDRLKDEIARLREALMRIKAHTNESYTLELIYAALREETTAASASVRAEHDRLMNDPRTRRLTQADVRPPAKEKP